MLGDDYMITHGLNTIPYCSAVRTELVCSSRDCCSHTEILMHSDFGCNFTRAALTYATITRGLGALSSQEHFKYCFYESCTFCC